MIIYRSQLFQNPVKVFKAFNHSEFFAMLDEIESLSKTYYAVGYIRYEAKNLFFDESYTNDSPLLYFEVFDKYEEYIPKNQQSYSLNPIPSISFEEYEYAINTVKNEILNGNTYEVNYTYDWLVAFRDEELSLYDYLLSRQKTPYNAFFKNEYDTVLSFSPELFFEIKDRHILTKPMKGTIARGRDYIEDKTNIEFLKNDIKNRAENVMIVDLLRNDLGRIARTGSVKAEKLFEIETHKTIHQMTSEVEADLKDDVSLADVIKAIFPCGSITGAPKISTMNIIDKVENGSRDIYCGAIAYLSPDELVCSVPIRILQRKTGDTTFKYRVGGAIVWDSSAQDEWEETITKTKFLQDDYSLVETVKVTNKKIFLAEEHFTRLKQSALELGFKFNEEILNIRPERDGILRILLHKNGDFQTELRQFERTHINNVRISPVKISSKNYLLKYKTTYRPFYIDTYKKIVAGEVYDELFFNERGELTEGSRTNILVESGGKFYTPPLKCGLLNGVLRQSLLDAGVCSERVMYLEDIINADAIYCINSVRGIKKVYLDDFNR